MGAPFVTLRPVAMASLMDRRLQDKLTEMDFPGVGLVSRV